MKILAIQPQKTENINIVTRGTIGEPLGLAIMLAIARSRGHEIMYVPYIESMDVLLLNVKDFMPDIVLFSLMTCQYPFGEEIGKKIKEIFPKSTIIAGGYHPSSNIKPAYPFDIYIKGEGEIPFEQLLSYFEKTNIDIDKKNIPGISYFDENMTYVSNLPERLMDIDKYPFPYRDFNVLLQKYYGLIYPHYLESFGFAYIEYSRGCYNSCSFCCKESMYQGNQIVFRKVEKVIEEIHYLMRNNIDLLFFTDLNFTANHQKVFELCNEIKKCKINISWFCMSNIDTAYNDELIKAMAEAGCVKIMYGVESLSINIQQETKKNLENIQQILGLADKHGILCQIFYMIGFPWETENDIYSLIPEIIQLPAHQIRIAVATPLPGSRWYEELDKSNLSQNDFSQFDTENLVWNDNKYSDISQITKNICQQFYSSEAYRERLESFLSRYPKYNDSFYYFFASLTELGVIEKDKIKIQLKKET